MLGSAGDDGTPGGWRLTGPVVPLLVMVAVSLVPMQITVPIELEFAQAITGLTDTAEVVARFEAMSESVLKAAWWTIGLIGFLFCVWRWGWSWSLPGAGGRRVFPVLVAGVVAGGAIGLTAWEIKQRVFGGEWVASEVYYVGWSAALKFGLMCVYAPLVEEVVFRGWLQRLGARVVGVWPAVVLQAVLFGLMHWTQGPDGMVVTGLIGVVLGSVYVVGRKLWVCMVCHALINLVLKWETLWWLLQGRAG